MPSECFVLAPTLKGGFRYKHHSHPPSSCHETEPRKRLGTTVSQETYAEILQLTERYKLRFSQILDEAIALGFMEKSAEALTNQRK